MLSKQAKEHDAKQKKTVDVDSIGEALKSCVLTARPANVADIDKEDHSNPQLCAEYVQEIYQYMHKLEVSTFPRYLWFLKMPKLISGHYIHNLPSCF